MIQSYKDKEPSSSERVARRENISKRIEELMYIDGVIERPDNAVLLHIPFAEEEDFDVTSFGLPEELGLEWETGNVFLAVMGEQYDEFLKNEITTGSRR